MTSWRWIHPGRPSAGLLLVWALIISCAAPSRGPREPVQPGREIRAVDVALLPEDEPPLRTSPLVPPDVLETELVAYADGYAASRGLVLDATAQARIAIIAREEASRPRPPSLRRGEALASMRSRLRTEVDNSLPRHAPKPPRSLVVATGLQAFARAYAAQRGFRFGDGAGGYIAQDASVFAQLIANKTASAEFALGKVVAERRLAEIVDEMIAYNVEHPEYARDHPHTIGEQTYAAAMAKLGLPLFQPVALSAMWKDALPFWTVNLERGGRRVTSLVPGRNHSVVVELATTAGAVSRVASSGLVVELQRRAEEPDPENVTLTAYLLQDGEHFEGTASSAEFEVDVRGFKRHMEETGKATGFTLATVKLPLTPRRRASGPASVAVLFWKEGVPIDEVVVSVCIEASPEPACPVPSIVPSEDKPDPVRPLVGEVPQPNAALHILELSRAPAPVVMGLLRADKSTVAWRLDTTFADIEAVAKDTIATALGAASVYASGRGVRGAGYELFNRIFPWAPPGVDDDAKRARLAFRKLTLAGYAAEPGKPRREPPTLFVRFVPRGGATPTLLPFGLMTVLPDGGDEAVVGLRYKVEMPLPRQSYGHTKCPSQWRVVGPDASMSEADLKDAWTAGERAFTAWGVDSSLDRFSEWLMEEKEDEPTFLLYTGHHHENRLYFVDNKWITPGVVTRAFRPPSVAMLNGCGTLSPGATRWVTDLNRLGMDAAIATSMSVPGKMAGDFVECLRAELDLVPAEGAALSDLHFWAVTCLTKDYGVRALAYSLVGNGAVRLCPPARRPGP